MNKFFLHCIFIFCFAFAEAQVGTIKVKKSDDTCSCQTSGKNEGKFLTTGLVHDTKKKPMSNVKIELIVNSIVIAVYCTDSNGNFSYNYLPKFKYTVHLSKCGYKMQEYKFTAIDLISATETMEITMFTESKKKKRK